jgi:hypothetical protein
MLTFASVKMLGIMRRLHLIILFYFLLNGFTSKAQNGLEGIIVERYYVSSTADTNRSAICGYLTPGSVTYRIFLDLQPNYRFYAAFGNTQHPLTIHSTTNFYNNEYIGNTIANVIPRRTLSKNTVLLDSWLSAGGAGEEYYGIPKEYDDTSNTILPEGNYLKNVDPSAGISLRQKDGLKESSGVPFPVIFGHDTLANAVYNRTKSNLLYTDNGAWGCLGGSMGLDSLGRNQVLIAQITTDGALDFALNIQIGKKGEKPEVYVANNPQEGEFVFPALTYNGDLPELKTSKIKEKLKVSKKELSNHSTK